MRIVSNAEELGKAIKDNDYPISVKKRSVGWLHQPFAKSVAICLDACSRLFGRCFDCVLEMAGVTMLITGMAGVATVGLVATAGGCLAIAAVGIDVTLYAVKIAAGGGSIKILSAIRSQEWNCSTKLDGALS